MLFLILNLVLPFVLLVREGLETFILVLISCCLMFKCTVYCGIGISSYLVPTGHIDNNDAGLVVHLFVDRMQKIKLFYFPLVFLLDAARALDLPLMY